METKKKNGGEIMDTYAFKDYGNVGVVTPLDAGFLLARPQNWKRRVDGMVVFQMIERLDVRLLNMKYCRVRELVPYNSNQMFLEKLYLGALVASEIMGLTVDHDGAKPYEVSYARRVAGSCHFILAQHGSGIRRVWTHGFHPKDLKHSMSMDALELEDGWEVCGNRVALDGSGLKCDCGSSTASCAHVLTVLRTSRHDGVMAAIRLMDSIRNYSRGELETLPFVKSVETIWLGQC